MAASNLIQYPKNKIKINDKAKEELKAKLDIRQVIEHYTGKVFKNNKILCPFHEEKTASFTINTEDQLYSCFGCGVGGDVIRFIESFMKVEFIEAIQILAKDFNINLECYSPTELKKIEKQRKSKQIIQEIYKTSLKHFQEQLNKEHIDFMNSKYGLTPETIKRAKIGYCKGDLLRYLRSKNYDDKDIYNSGLVTKKDGKLKDMFFNRIMIPYLEHNQVKYFTGRSLKVDDNFKYLNLKHTTENIKNPLFLARIGQSNKLILVEGEFTALSATELTGLDVIALGKSGLSKSKKDDLFKYAEIYKEIIIINDSDKNKAGIKGAIDTAKDILLNKGIVCKIGQLESIEGQNSTDIADYNRDNKDLKPIIDNAIDFIELLIKDIEKLKSGRAAINQAKELYSLLALVEEEYRNYYIELIRESIGTIKGCSKSTLNKSTIQEGIEKARNQVKNKGDTFNKPWFEFSDKGSVKFKPAILAKYLLKQNYYICLSDNLYKYKDGVYIEGGETEINKTMMKKSILDDEWEVHRADSVISYIKRFTKENPISLFSNNKYDNLVNVKNGMIDLETAIFDDEGNINLKNIEVLEHDPKYQSFTQIVAKFNPGAKCKKLDQAVSSILLDRNNPDYAKVKVFWEFIGWIIFNGELELKKALLLVGDGDNGKTVLLNFLTELLGKNNIGAVGLYDLIVNQYAASDLFGKIANLAGEMTNNIIKDIEIFKKVTGGDLIRADQKYKEPLEFKNKAKLIFALNSLPKVADYEEAFFNRLIIMKAPNTFSKDSPEYDPHILKKITTEEALSHGLNRAIEGFARLVINDFNFTESEQINADLRDYQAEANTAIPFINEVCNLKPEAVTNKSRLYDIYKDWASKNGFGQMSKKKLTKRINQGFKQLSSKKARFGNDTGQAWIGLEIKPEFDIRL